MPPIILLLAYVNASNIDWIMEKKLTINDEIGEIVEKYDPKLNSSLSATKLEIGKKVYTSNEDKMVILIKTSGTIVPFFKWVEG